MVRYFLTLSTNLTAKSATHNSSRGNVVCLIGATRDFEVNRLIVIWYYEPISHIRKHRTLLLKHQQMREVRIFSNYCF